MALENRGKSVAFYKKTRQNGRVTSTYVAYGQEAIALEAERQAIIKERQALDSIAQAVADYFKAVETVYVENMEQAGYHRPNRGPWRKKRTK